MEEWYWTAMRIFRAQDCLRAFFFGYIEKRDYCWFPHLVRGLVLHSVADKKFFYKRDKRKQYILDAKGGPIPKYKSAEKFANAARAKWYRDTKEDSYRNKKINWEKKQERFWIADDVWQIAYHLYERKLREGAPIFSEIPFKFSLVQRRGDRKVRREFGGRIDEIRKGQVIRDYKFGRYTPTDIALRNDLQFTLYLLAVGSLCYFDEDFAEKFRVHPDIAKSWAGNPIFLTDKINIERFTMFYDWIEEAAKNRRGKLILDEQGNPIIKKRKKVFINPILTRRVNAQFQTLCDVLDDLETRLERVRETKNIKDVSFNRRNCKNCLFKEEEECSKEGMGCEVKKPYQMLLFVPPKPEPEAIIESASYEKPRLKPRVEADQQTLKFPREKKKSQGV